MSCLIITPEIRELAKKFPNETEQSVLNLVGLWQEKNNKSIEDIPLGSELNDFIKEFFNRTITLCIWNKDFCVFINQIRNNFYIVSTLNTHIYT